MPFIIFTTAYATYALDAFEVDAADYLLKPFDADRFRQALTRIRERVMARDKSSIRLEMASEIKNVLKEIQTTGNRPDRLVVEKGGRLLVVNINDVDDEAICRDSLRDYCKREKDINLLAECRNGDDAVKEIRSLKPDLVFLDIHMPRLGGFDVIKKIGHENMPFIIFTTAYATYALDAFEVDAADYLLKPFAVS